MRISSRHSDPRLQTLQSEVQLLRIRVAAAEAESKVLHERARQSARRRKEIKRIARQAKKQFKRAGIEVLELRQALAKAESKLSRIEQKTSTKTAKARPSTKNAGPRAKGASTGVVPSTSPNRRWDITPRHGGNVTATRSN